MKKFGAIFAFTILVLSFQNCSQPGIAPEGELISQNSNSPQKVALDSAEQMIVINNSKLSGLSDEAYSIDLSNGMVIPGSLEGVGLPSSKSFCATQEQIEELKVLLSSSEVCVPPVNVVDENQVCTLEYQYPYATLMSDQLELKLGEKRGGCEQPVDLCGQQKELLRGWISHLLTQLKSQECTFQEI